MKEHTCKDCGDTFTDEELRELHELGEPYHLEKGCFLCPDCWANFQRLPPEEQLAFLLK